MNCHKCKKDLTYGVAIYVPTLSNLKVKGQPLQQAALCYDCFRQLGI